jgi:hypothetical protein
MDLQNHSRLGALAIMLINILPLLLMFLSPPLGGVGQMHGGIDETRAYMNGNM